MTSGSLNKESTRRWRPRRFWLAAVGVSILIAVLALFASQQGGDGDSSGPLNAIAAAAEKTQGEPGGRGLFRAIVSSPVESESLTITGRMSYSGERARGVMRFADPKSGEPVKMEIVGDGTQMYMRSSLFGSLPDGSEWMGLDLSIVPTGEAPIPANVDARGELAVLEAMTGEVQRLGEEEVRGVPTTRYRGEVDNAERAEQLREEGAEKLASEIDDGSPLRAEAWIDSKGLIRRMRFVDSKPREKGDGSTTTDMRIDYFDLGIEPVIEVPEPNDVYDMTAIVQEELDLPD